MFKDRLGIFLTTFIFVILSLPAFAKEENLEEIRIRKIISEDVKYFSFEEIEKLPFFSSEEIVDYSASVDLIKRSNFGIQQDPSIRGSLFEDNFITLNGIKLNDFQTGHFNLELPLTYFDLERVEVLKNSQKINFMLKKPKEKGIYLRTGFGQHALWEKLLSFNFPLKGFKNRFSLEHKISSGAGQDTDFDIYNLSYYALCEKEEKEMDFFYGHTQRDFGADSFYSVKFPHQEEHIKQNLGFIHTKFNNWENQIYFRRHKDTYILNRHNPSFYKNQHKTHLWGLNSKFDILDNFFLNFNIEKQKLTSTRLNRHTRFKKSFLLGLKDKVFNNFIFSFYAGLDGYHPGNYLEDIYLGIGYLLDDYLKLRISFNRFGRAPSFTELYYSDPANQGNPDLKNQKTDTLEFGFDVLDDKQKFGFSFFFKNQLSTIDWVKNLSSEPWQAKNIGRINSFGFELNYVLKFNLRFLESFSLDYTYLNLRQKNPHSYSKYVFDHNQHKLVGIFNFKIKKINLNLISNFSNPCQRKSYTTFDLKIGKNFKNYEFFIEGVNIFNQNYEEAKDIKGIRRWYKCGLSISF
jgi:iron complex outermembrane receptor protein